ncbi:MAG: hypothetical protein HY727_09155 [Candidatus Rokubacteria bacterium]|nr:hypothetical protein [Candidatus Rokubacteria bacterium]
MIRWLVASTARRLAGTPSSRLTSPEGLRVAIDPFGEIGAPAWVIALVGQILKSFQGE